MRGGGSVEGEVAIVIVHPAAGNWTEDAEDGVQALGLGVVAVRTTPDDEG